MMTPANPHALARAGRRWLVIATLAVAGAGLGGCAVVSVVGATAGAAIAVTGAVVSTGVSVTGKVVGKAVDAVTPGDADE